MSNPVTLKEKEHINAVLHEAIPSLGYCFSWNQIAKILNRSADTVKRHYDELWYPGKYYLGKEVLEKTEYTTLPGLYMLSCANILDDGTEEYLIKVGQGKNLNQRIHSYIGSNPNAKCVATKICSNDMLNQEERACHMMLNKYGIRKGNTEWFSVSKTDYFKLKERNFQMV